MATHIVVVTSFFLSVVVVVAGSFTGLLRDSASSLQEAEKTAFTWTNCGCFYHQNINILPIPNIYIFLQCLFLSSTVLSLYQMQAQMKTQLRLFHSKCHQIQLYKHPPSSCLVSLQCVILFFFSSTQMLCYNNKVLGGNLTLSGSAILGQTTNLSFACC